MRAAGLWGAFLIVHIAVAWLGWVLPSQPMGDVVLVYEPWAASALGGGPIVGIDESWVYPQPALLPMVIAKVLSWPLMAMVDSTGAYLIAWAVLITALDAVGFGVLIGRSGSAARRAAGWFWTAALLLLGPIAMYRIDAITVPAAVIAGCWMVRRPALAALVLTLGAWIKIWPGAVLVAAVVAARARVRMLATAVLLSAGIVLLLFLLGAGPHLFGFLSEQTARGLQIESVAATPLMWMAHLGAASVDYSFEILTFQISAPGAEILAAVLTPIMALAAVAIVAFGAWKAAQGASFNRLLPPLALALVTTLIVTNKVGSPQFQTWLIAPVGIWILLDRTRSAAPAALVLVLCGVTCLIYPLTYDALLRTELLPMLLLTARNLLLIALLLVALRALARVPGTRATPPRRN